MNNAAIVVGVAAALIACGIAFIINKYFI